MSNGPSPVDVRAVGVQVARFGVIMLGLAIGPVLGSTAGLPRLPLLLVRSRPLTLSEMRLLVVAMSWGSGLDVTPAA